MSVCVYVFPLPSFSSPHLLAFPIMAKQSLLLFQSRKILVDCWLDRIVTTLLARDKHQYRGTMLLLLI